MDDTNPKEQHDIKKLDITKVLFLVKSAPEVKILGEILNLKEDFFEKLSPIVSFILNQFSSLNKEICNMDFHPKDLESSVSPVDIENYVTENKDDQLDMIKENWSQSNNNRILATSLSFTYYGILLSSDIFLLIAHQNSYLFVDGSIHLNDKKGVPSSMGIQISLINYNHELFDTIFWNKSSKKNEVIRGDHSNSILAFIDSLQKKTEMYSSWTNMITKNLGYHGKTFVSSSLSVDNEEDLKIIFKSSCDIVSKILEKYSINPIDILSKSTKMKDSNIFSFKFPSKVETLSFSMIFELHQNLLKDRLAYSKLYITKGVIQNCFLLYIVLGYVPRVITIQLPSESVDQHVENNNDVPKSCESKNEKSFMQRVQDTFGYYFWRPTLAEIRTESSKRLAEETKQQNKQENENDDDNCEPPKKKQKTTND